VRDVLVKVCQNQEHVQHSLALIRIRRVGLFQIFHDGERIGQKPFDFGSIELAPLAAAVERMIRSHRCFVKEVDQAQLFGCERGWNCVRASRPPADPLDRSAHQLWKTPLGSDFSIMVRRDYQIFVVAQ
jgi:hypothetical protein